MSRKRILLIEPDPQTAETLQHFLEHGRYSVTSVRAGAEALEAVARHRFDIVLMEIVLPDVAGMDLLRLLVNGPNTSSSLIIVVSVEGSEVTQVSALAIGARDYLTKPFSVNLLLARIGAQLRSVHESLRLRYPGDPMTVRPTFLRRDFRALGDSVFILMPFSATWSGRVWALLQETASQEGFTSKRADELYGHDVLEDIWVALNEANVVIADATGRNPNVMYEIGVAHTLGKHVVLLTQNPDDIPFDFRRYRHIVYEDNVDGFAKVRHLLPNFLRERKLGDLT